MELVEQVLGTVRRYEMFVPGQTVGVAVSGGADSVCLLDVLGELAAGLRISLAVLHLNHKLRGEDSDADERFVRELAAVRGLPFFGEVCEVAAAPDNLEQAGREARRSFFLRLIRQGTVNRVATGHTRSDQAETVLYRLLRGSGTAGLAGILPVTAEGIGRPLIDCSRSGVEAYLRAHGSAWREDRTNADPGFARNRIRHGLLPTIAADYSPAIVEILAATSEVARAEEEYWRVEVQSLAARLFTRRAGAILMSVNDLRPLHIAVLRRLAREAVREIRGDLRGIDIAHLEAILSLVGRDEGHGRVQVPGADVFRSFEWLRFSRIRREPRQARDYSIPIGDFPYRAPLPGGAFMYLEIQEEAGRGDAPDRYNGIDLDRIDGALELRNWHPGDALDSRRLKLLFQEGRVPIWERQTWPLLVAGGAVVWARRFGAAKDFAPTANTRRVLRVYEVEGPEAYGESRESNLDV